MKPFSTFVSGFVLTALLTLLSLRPYAQSTNTSSQKNDTTAAVGLNEIQQYVQNSRAVLDSLMRFQDAKINLQLKNKQVSTLQTQLTECHIQSTKLRTDANEMAVRLFDANTSYEILHRRFRRAQLERWAWRIGTGIVAGFWIKNSLIH